MENTPKVRISHRSANIEKAIFFYRDGLGFDVLDRYEDVLGFDGVIFGHKDWPYQFEVYTHRGESYERRVSTDSPIVFSIPEEADWERRLEAMFNAGFTQVPISTRYDDGASACFEDPDGFRFVLRKGRWKK